MTTGQTFPRRRRASPAREFTLPAAVAVLIDALPAGEKSRTAGAALAILLALDDADRAAVMQAAAVDPRALGMALLAAAKALLERR